MRKFIFVLCLLLGLTMVGYGGYNSATIALDSYNTSAYIQGTSSNNKVIVKDKLVTNEKIKDDEFDVEVTSPVLVREVEMVQWYKDEDKGIRLVLANYQLDSFEEDGVKYVNPTFYSDIERKVFLGSATIKDLTVDQSVLEGVVKEFYKGSLDKTYVKELVNDKNKAYDLVIRDGDYVTPSNEWQLGDVRVSFYYLADQDITVVGNVSNSKISIRNNGLVYGTEVTRDEILKDLAHNLIVYGPICIGGILFIIIGFAVKGKKKNKKDKKEVKNIQQAVNTVKKDETKVFEDDVVSRLQDIINNQNK